MHDDTPPPFGDLTRRWTGLTDDDRARHARRLVAAVGCPDHHWAHVDRPVLDEGVCYLRLVRHAVAGDPIAVGWLADTHRPLLVTRGKVLLDRDPAEWAATCVEVLHATIARADESSGRWLRRRISDHLALQLARIVRRHLHRRAHERPTAPHVLPHTASGCVVDGDPHPDLSIAVDRSLRELDAATRDALQALANHEPLAELTDRHHLTDAALRQRACRARRQLRPQLAGFVRGAA